MRASVFAGVVAIGVLALVPLTPPAAGQLELRNDGVRFPDGSVQTTAAPRDPRRAFYLTPTTRLGNAAAGACAAGFHFASMWEVLGVPGLRYDSARGFVQADSGQGPPSGVFGWMRTGGPAAGDQAQFAAKGDGGTTNCDAWTSGAATRNGTIAFLAFCWQEEADCFAPTAWENVLGSGWFAAEQGCATPAQVWCVEDRPGSGG